MFIFDSTTSNISDPNESSTKDDDEVLELDNEKKLKNSQISDDSELFLKPKSTATLSRKPKMNEFQKNVLEVLSQRKTNQDITNDIDEDKLFLLSFLPTLKKMSSHQKFDFKIQMTQVLKNINFPNQTNSSQTHLICNTMQNSSDLNLKTPTINYTHQYQHQVPKYISNNYQSSIQNSIPIHYQSSTPNIAVNPYQNLNHDSYGLDPTFSPSPPTTSNQSSASNVKGP